MRVSSYSCPGATRIELTDGIRRASENDGLPLAHQMLQTGWDATLAGDLRRAVIDTGTAAEVSLASFVAADSRPVVSRHPLANGSFSRRTESSDLLTSTNL